MHSNSRETGLDSNRRSQFQAAGRSLPPGRSVVDFRPYLQEINLKIGRAVSIELEYSPEPEKIEEWVAEAYRETDRLMRDVGLRR